MQPDTVCKQTFIAGLWRFALVGGDDLYDPVYERVGYDAYRGERILAKGLAEYFNDPRIPGDVFGANWYRDLPMHLIDAFVEFRSAAKWVTLRADYLRDAGHEIPDLVEIHLDGMHRLLVTNQLARLCVVLTGELWLKARLEAHFHAQQCCVDQAWGRFVRAGYRELMPRIKVEAHRGNRGIFGTTTLLTFSAAGRCMFTFARGDADVTYVADESDMYGNRSGMNTTMTPYAECVAMINEVADHWDLQKMQPAASITLAGT